MLNQLNYLIVPMLGIATASMIYVAMADLIPSLHKRPAISATIQQVVLIMMGIGSIWLIEILFSHHH